jgi:Copper type II ascorbate-dependent monooxygenase, C-terminal domain/DOMON domain/Copper type II ascorbate-dependent monooxygenase, N-terminal domain
MKTTSVSLAASLLPSAFLLFGVVSAQLECDIQISRQFVGDTPAACAHFEGIDASPYVRWFNDLQLDTNYPGMVYLQGSDPARPEDGAAIHWKIGEEDGEGYIYFAVAARATGWLGFGIAEAGGMLGADMALFEAAKPDEIVDAFTDDTRFPQTDDCPSDWKLVSSEVDEEGGFIMIEFKRKLDTKDSQDRVIFHDESTLVAPHRIIAAWGDSSEVAYHGLNVARGAVRFYGTGDDRATFDTAMEQADGSFMVASINHAVSTNETEYFHTCVPRNDLLAQGVLNTTDLLNIIGFEPVLQEENVAYLHHYIVSGYAGDNCDALVFPEVVYVWAPGDGPVSLPSFLGTPMFGADGFNAFEIEVHYNNPQGTAGLVDNSGVRVFWTSEPREQQMGILSTGDPQVSLMGQEVGNGISRHTFECPGTCSSVVGQEVTVLREHLHMHEIGARMTNEQIRDGQVLRTAAIDYWEFDQNGNAAIQQDPFVIKPGDGFKTTCYFNGNDDRVFGMASSEEMCMTFLYYYPRAKIRIEEIDLEFPWICGFGLGFEPCETNHQADSLASLQDLDRNFGVSSGETCDVATVDTPNDEPNAGETNSGATVAILSSASAVTTLALSLLF